MKRILSAAALIAILTAATAPAMAANVGLSISIGQPGFYGQINLGAVPVPPALIYSQPVVVQRVPSYVGGPIYLHVPAGYERHWYRHCAQYFACNRPVYFVRDDWYQRQYVPRYRERHEWQPRREYWQPWQRDWHQDRRYDNDRHNDRYNDRDDHGRHGDRHEDHHDDRRGDRDHH